MSADDGCLTEDILTCLAVKLIAPALQAIRCTTMHACADGRFASSLAPLTQLGRLTKMSITVALA